MSNKNAVVEAVPSACGLREFVVARVGDTHVAVAADRVETVLDAQRCAKPPVDEAWVGGWFLHRDRFFLNVRLQGRGPRTPGAKRIVVRESDDVRFAIEVDEVFGSAVLDDVSPEKFAKDEWHAPSEWLQRGSAHDGRPVCCVDVDAIGRQLFNG